MSETPHGNSPAVESLLDAVAARAAAPLDQMTALPPAIYHNPAIYDLEQRLIFAKEWFCAGWAAEIPHAGDYLTYSIGDQPIIVMRGTDGRIRSFSNVCLHRMMRLLDGQGNCSRIVCPYHAWSYDLDGRLVGAGHIERTPEFKAKHERLPEIRTELWEGWIYVTLDPEAPSVADRLAPLAALVKPYRMAGYVPITTQDHVWKTNWKILTENFMESYHLPVAHRKTVGAWYPIKETKFPAANFEAFTCQTFIKDADATYGLAHPANTSLEGEWRYTSVMPTIFPTHMFVLAPDHLWYLSLRPHGVGEVKLRFGVALAPEVLAALDDPDAYKREALDFFDRVNEEDRRVVEAIFENARAPLARSGRLSWLERELHDFAGYLDWRLGAARGKNIQDRAKTGDASAMPLVRTARSAGPA